MKITLNGKAKELAAFALETLGQQVDLDVDVEIDVETDSDEADDDSQSDIAVKKLDVMREALINRISQKENGRKIERAWSRYCGAVEMAEELGLIAQDQYANRVNDSNRIIALAQSGPYGVSR